MEDLFNKSLISDILINWYTTNKRVLPWRDISDPYKIWISEIILQQTRVNQGLDYYLRFINRFPTVESLASAEEDEVLKNWQGLGYYSRARNIHKAANQIMTQFDGLFPIEYSDVIGLAGIGTYTAAAICSFAYKQPYAVLDGNVYRVLSRLFGIETPIDTGVGKKEFELIAGDLMSKDSPDVYNQAIMEFGALQCLPSSPDCGNCPMSDMCNAYKLQLIAYLPVKSKKKVASQRYLNYIYVQFRNNTFLQKRTAKDIWQNLYEFPLIEFDRLINVSELLKSEEFKMMFRGIKEVEVLKITNPMKHVLSHRVINAQFITVNISELNDTLKGFILVKKTEIHNYPVSRLMEKFLEQNF